jgi:hypothetical protein
VGVCRFLERSAPRSFRRVKSPKPVCSTFAISDFLVAKEEMVVGVGTSRLDGSFIRVLRIQVAVRWLCSQIGMM